MTMHNNNALYGTWVHGLWSWASIWSEANCLVNKIMAYKQPMPMASVLYRCEHGGLQWAVSEWCQILATTPVTK